MSLTKSVLILSLGVAIGICPAQTSSTKPTPREPDRESLLVLPWKEFDQTQESGWRWYMSQEPKRYLEAARLIEAYLERHDELLPRQRALCHFHAAHTYIFRPLRTGVGNPLEALPHLDKALVPSGSPAPSADWNDLVIAVRAFLKGDRPALLAVRDRIAAMPPDTIKFLKSPNRPDDLLHHLGEPYGSWFPQAEIKK